MGTTETTLSTAEAAAWLGVGAATVERAQARGRLPKVLTPAILAQLRPDARAGGTPEGGSDADAGPDENTIELVVGMDYPGKVISVGHCYRQVGGQKFLHKVAKRWRAALAESLGVLAREALRAGGTLALPVTVRIDADYVDAHHATDPDNLAKLTYDAVELALGINDRHYTPVAGVVSYGALIPSLTITVTVRRA